MISFGKTIIIVASSTVIIPYSIAFLAYIMCGRNYKISKKWSSIIHPRKIIAINYAMLKQLKKLKYLKLYLQMIFFYKNASKEKLIKNIHYGSNNNCLDIYIPGNHISKKEKLPVTIFIYGGTWSSGDKNLYGLLCSNISQILHSIVVCPNYTLYPKGFVDDMVQDVSDTLFWIYANISMYGGDKDRIIMIGHSAGGHLCALTLIELAMKRNMSSRLDRGPETSSLNVSLIKQSKLDLKDSHFNEDNNKLDSINHVEASFIMVPPANENESMYLIEKSNIEDNEKLMNDEKEASNNDDNKEIDISSLQIDNDLLVINNDEISLFSSETINNVDDSTNNINIFFPDNIQSSIMHSNFNIDNTDNNINVEASSMKSELISNLTSVAEIIVDEDVLFEKILPCVKLFIGLAGVYDIVDHFEFEKWRGIEDLSHMTSAMYDNQHFPLCSPSRLIKCLSNINLLPPIYLYHGSADTIVPCSSSIKFGETLSALGHSNINAIIFSDCDHYDICLDIMDENRGWYSTILSQIQNAFYQYI